MSDPTPVLDGQLALVTGASRGIGAVIARGLAVRGATVICLARDSERLIEQVQAMVDDGLDTVALGCDLGQERDLDTLRDRLAQTGEVDVLVHCAAVMSEQTAKTLRTTPQEWRRVMSTDLDAAFRLTTTVGPGMVQRRRGRIVHYSACLGRMSGPGNAGGLAPYRIAKAGVNAMVRNLSHELGHGRRGVLVDAVCPGHCRTDMGGAEAPRSPEEGADTGLWLVERDAPASQGPNGVDTLTGLLWEDRTPVPW
ncbi:MAG: SDR family NAD(P)-dependent oxidoreductase [Mycobacteriaceae bacterium]